MTDKLEVTQCKDCPYLLPQRMTHCPNCPQRKIDQIVVDTCAGFKADVQRIMADTEEYTDLITGKSIEPWAQEILDKRGTRQPSADLVEAVARAIATAFGSPWDWFTPQGQEAARTEARAAIAAMPDTAALVAEVAECRAEINLKADFIDATLNDCAEQYQTIKELGSQLTAANAKIAALTAAGEKLVRFSNKATWEEALTEWKALGDD